MGQVSAIIVAGGKGTRMGRKIKKQYLKLNGKEVLAHTVGAFERSSVVDEIIVVTSEEDVAYVSELLCKTYAYTKIKCVVPGGQERQDSVYNGLQQLSETARYVMIHDGARPLVEEETLINGLEAARMHRASVVAVPVKDTIKVVDKQGQIVSTPARDTLWSVQTPQTFEVELIKCAHKWAKEKHIQGTDDSMLVEQMGTSVYVAEGSYTNIKITTPEDLIVAESMIE